MSFLDSVGRALDQSFGPTAYTEKRSTPFVWIASKLFKLDKATENRLQKAYNIALNILGYIPFACWVSGAIRGLEALTAVVILIAKKTDTKDPYLVQVAQLARAAFEAVVPFGHLVTFGLDLSFTLAHIVRGR